MSTNRELWEQHAKHLEKYLPMYLEKGYAIDVEALEPPKRITQKRLDDFLTLKPKDYVKKYGELIIDDTVETDTTDIPKITQQSDIPLYDKAEYLQDVIDSIDDNIAFNDGSFSDVIIEEFKEYIRGYHRSSQVEELLFSELEHAIDMASEQPNGKRNYIKGKNVVADAIRNTPLPTIEDLYTPETADHYMQQLFQNLNLKQEDVDRYFEEQEEVVYGLQEEMWEEFYNSTGYSNYKARRRGEFTPRRRGSNRRGE